MEKRPNKLRTISELLNEGKTLLEQKGIPNAELDVQLIMADALNCNRLKLIMRFHETIDLHIEKEYSRKLVQRLARIPVDYILGKKEFMGFDFMLEDTVLIPRPETEILVEEAVKLIHNQNISTVMEIGVGSGNIAVSIAKLSNCKHVTGIDVSKEAVRIAKENARINKVREKVTFDCIDLFSPEFSNLPKYDLIVSNPPYIAEREFNDLQPEIFYEPRQALDGGVDGLIFYEYIAATAKEHLNKNGYIVLEIGYNQLKSVKRIFENNKYCIYKVIEDYSGYHRVLVVRWVK
ncbi:MAG: protein-(glutamine-N5) methyltransferase, release factor-specific [Elusimicrobia bacterium RIFOXYA2_FULL_39_19]|nr:MAG: protein-(glutamine-N5) methyltransferase, release factor-specific [Elusimicrobia bacterium RIFOXYA2_FULL_39_19]